MGSELLERERLKKNESFELSSILMKTTCADSNFSRVDESCRERRELPRTYESCRERSRVSGQTSAGV